MYRLPINEETKLERGKEGRETRGVIARRGNVVYREYQEFAKVA